MGKPRARRAMEDDAGVAQQPRQPVGDPGPEHRQRRLLRAHDRDLDLGIHVVSAVGGHERELVQRQRPERLPRGHERDLAHVALLDVLHEPAQRATEVAIVDRDGTVERGLHPRAARDHERVVADRRSGAGRDALLGSVHGRERAGDELGIEVGGDAGELDAARMGDRERLGHRHRAVVKVAPGRQQRDPHAVAGNLAEGHHGLQCRDAAAGDEDVERK